MSMHPFEKVMDASTLLPILEKRLPKSCFMYNQAKMQQRFSARLLFYVLHGEINESSWIVSTHYREDYGLDISISAIEESSKISKDEATAILSECKLFNWDEPYCFVSLEKWLSKIIYDISASIKGNPTEVLPCLLYYMEPEDCLQVEIRTEDPSVEIKKLDHDVPGSVGFILKTWKYAKEGTRTVVQRIIEKSESAGVYVDGNLVCGVVTSGFGLLGMLHTHEDHRQKGYGKLCLRFAFKEIAENGMVPALTVESGNQPSVTFHEKLGCKVAGLVDWINFLKPEVMDITGGIITITIELRDRDRDVFIMYKYCLHYYNP